MKEQGIEHSGQRRRGMCEDLRWNRAWKEPKETGNLFSREENQVATVVTFYSIVLFEFFHVNA